MGPFLAKTVHWVHGEAILNRLKKAALLCGVGSLLVLSAPTSAVEPTTAAEAVTAVEGFYANVQSMEASFVQVTRSPSMGTWEEQRGRILLKRPRQMRWDFTRPDRRLFVTDGQQMWIHSPEDNQVIHYQDVSGAAASGGIDSLLSEMDKLDESFNVALVEDADAARLGHFSLILTPKQEAPFKSLLLEVHKRKLTLKSILVIDSFDNETELRFSNVKVNGNVDDSQFKFDVPEDAELIQPDAL